MKNILFSALLLFFAKMVLSRHQALMQETTSQSIAKKLALDNFEIFVNSHKRSTYINGFMFSKADLILFTSIFTDLRITTISNLIFPIHSSTFLGFLAAPIIIPTNDLFWQSIYSYIKNCHNFAPIPALASSLVEPWEDILNKFF